ncbi:MAG: hypothetical protein AAF765_08525 [Bacteroidota bacterium]
MNKVSITGFLLLVIRFFPYTGIAQNASFLETKLSNKLVNYRTSERPEKMYVATDKEFYVNGETIWFKAYLVDGISHVKSEKSRVIYVQLLDSKAEPIQQKRFYVSDIGASGEFELSEKISAGNYTLRAYTRYTFNEEQPLIFEKIIPVYSADSKNKYEQAATLSNVKAKKEEVLKSRLQVRFFPEGGQLVNGLLNTMGIEIFDTEGNPVAVKGNLINQEGKVVTPFTTYEFGLGAMAFTPRGGDLYVAQIQYNGKLDTYNIPKPKEQGYQLNVYNRKEEILIHISASQQRDLKNMVIIGHVRGETVFLQKIAEPSADGHSFTVKLMTENLPDGVAHFTLFTPFGEPVCERLTFIDNPKNEVKLHIGSDKENYSFRDIVSVDLQMTELAGQTLPGELSVSVVPVDAGIKGKIKSASSMKAWLLLESDLAHSIPNADYFFVDDSNRRKYLLDVLLLTHGWRRFVWKDMLNRTVSKNITYLPEQGLTVYGRVSDFKNKYRSLPSSVKMTFFNELEIFQLQKDTRSDGSFDFGPFMLLDSVPAVVEATYGNGNKNKDAAVQIHPVFFNYPENKTKDLQEIELLPSVDVQPYLKRAEQKRWVDFQYGSNITQLDEVAVVAKRITPADVIDKEIKEMVLYGEPRARTYVDSISGQEFASAMDVLRFVPGIQVFGDYPNQKVSVRGASSISSSPDPLF